MAVSAGFSTVSRNLEALLAPAAGRARRFLRPVLASVTLPAPVIDPLALFERALWIHPVRHFWRAPDAGPTLVGAGIAAELTGSGAGRFSTIRRSWETLSADALVERPVDEPGTGPTLLGGFAFDPERPDAGDWADFPDAGLILPRLLYASTPRAAWLTLTACLQPGADAGALAAQLARDQAIWLGGASPERPWREPARLSIDTPDVQAWLATVAGVAGEIRRCSLEKAVVARQVRVRATRRFSPGRVLGALQAAQPSSYLFALDRGSRCFLGATPERLVQLWHGDLRAMCLAGSIGRGANPDEDRRLGERLIASEKDQREHAVVVRTLRAALSALCGEVSSPGAPSLLKLRDVQHLCTPISGRLADGQTILDLVERLHPTPAVCGHPRERALALIREMEPFNRGWYAGPVGWMDHSGCGEFAVAIRSALIHAQEALLFAGCGIMGESEPAREYHESSLKLQTMLSALEETVA